MTEEVENLDSDLEEQGTEEGLQSGEPESELRSALRAAIEEESPAADESAQVRESNRVRDGRGRFTSGKQVSDQATQAKDDEATLGQPIAPPYSWSGEHKELFSQLPRSMQEYLTKREQERESFIGRKSQEVSSIRDKYAPVDRILSQYGDMFSRANLDPVQGVERLILAQQYLDRDPVGALKLMAQSYGLDLSQIASGAEQSGTSPAFPQMHYLTNELDSIRGKLAAFEQEKTAQLQRAAVGEVETFANEIDKSGKLLRPFMADVHEQMMEEIPLIRSRNPEASSRQVLQQAYDTACWKNSSVRGRLIEQQQQPQIQAARVQQAKLAGSSVRGAPGATALSGGSGNSIRDALLAAFDSHS